MNLRKIILQIHLIGGLVAAIVLLLLSVTGSLMVFENEINWLLNPKLSYVIQLGPRLSLNELSRILGRAYPGSRVTAITLPPQENLAYNISLRDHENKPLNLAVNPYNGEVLGSLDEANRFTGKLHQFHKNLLLGEKGKLITGWGAIFLVALSLSGIWLWWRQRIYRFSGAESGSRRNFEWHNVVGIYSSVYLLIFALTGIVIHWEAESQQLANKLTGSAAAPPPPKPEPATKGAPRLSVDELVEIAEKTVPGARISSLQLNNPTRISMKYPEDGTPAGRTNLYLDPVTGKVLFLQTSRTAPLGTRLVKLWNRELHTGDLYGWPTRLLACAMSLGLTLLVITGPLIWWGRWRRKEK